GGVWHPFHKEGPKTFIPMLLNACEGICLGTRAIQERAPHARFMHIDTCEKHHALDDRAQAEADLRNVRRFVAHDLVRGCVDHRHPEWTFLLENGLTEERAIWLRSNPARVDLL